MIGSVLGIHSKVLILNSLFFSLRSTTSLTLPAFEYSRLIAYYQPPGTLYSNCNPFSTLHFNFCNLVPELS